MFNALSIVKFITSTAVAVGTGKIVGAIIKNNVPPPATIVEKVTIYGASWVIGGMAGNATKGATNEMIDEAATAVAGVTKHIKHAGKLARVNRGESTFEAEGLDPTNYTKDDSGRWVKGTPDLLIQKTDVSAAS